MEDNIKVKYAIIIIVIIILITSSIYILNTQESSENITALEGKEIADEIAEDWNSNATLTNILYTSENNQWMYRYWNGEDDIINSYQIVVYPDKATTTHYNTRQESVDYPIDDGFIDSDEAIEICESTDNYSQLESYNPEIKSIHLYHSPTQDENLWQISWKPDDNDTWLCMADINPYTGEIIDFWVNEYYQPATP